MKLWKSIILILIVCSFSSICYAEEEPTEETAPPQQTTIDFSAYYSEARDVSNAYKDVRDMFSGGMNYPTYTEINNKAKLQSMRFCRNHELDENMKFIIKYVKNLQHLHNILNSAWRDHIFSGMTDTELTSADRNTFPSLKAMHGDIWGKFDSVAVINSMIDCQDNCIRNLDKAIRIAQESEASGMIVGK